MNWGKIFRQLAIRYGFTPAEVGALTVPQLLAYLETDEEGSPSRRETATYEDILYHARRARGQE